MSVKPIDTFITSSVKLFEVNPSQTTFTISYRGPSDTDNNKKKTSVSFRSHNAHLGVSYKFNTNKSKDVSRLLNAIGPRGVSITPGKIEKNKMIINGKKIVVPKNSSKKKKLIQDIVGLGSLITNSDVKEYIPPVHTTNENTTANAANKKSEQKGKKNKNKNKKKR
ncbi:signal recognition particle subunit SRP21 NDAI_0K01400 [Naumovozyma dairenensis CBS 421]|uniref:SRP9 domain-containing protein n=1 Tax=Naumovozyma dairenensis (strain ATCC 10597 / BCRC 20456 / CBS 421 / NBRC 0211 / NRRL Y-12639) TaxID=1071378 RepID=G0WHS0_NAUDC|nr:hypothetical protein NDAI_0K01400 [Naumovozyma dairenensis CBS 421]CCD27331.1 hypothetical protein NDAI_0K01400 [Naumovozyma dairenensis CBS 421]